MDDKCVVPGAGAFELACSEHLNNWAKTSVTGKAKLGVNAYADALLVVPRTLAVNSGFDAMDTILKIQEAHQKDGKPWGVDCNTGDPMPSDV